MTFSLALSEEQQSAQQWAHDFAEKEIRPAAAHYDETEEFPWEIVKKAAGIGLYGLDYYQMSGQDPTGLTSNLVVEEIFWGCAGIGLAIFGSGLCLAGLASSGTMEQIGQWAWGRPELGLTNWERGRLLGRSGILAGDDVYTVRDIFTDRTGRADQRR